MILIALGANLPSSFGEPEQTLKRAVADIQARGVRVIKQSSIWKTAPVPVSDQPWYRNAVIRVETNLHAMELLQLLHSIEESFGRIRTVKNAPRVLDLDLIAYNSEIIDEDGVYIPHPRMHNRSFVLRPLQEVAPSWKHPILKRSIDDLIQALPTEEDSEKSLPLAA